MTPQVIPRSNPKELLIKQVELAICGFLVDIFIGAIFISAFIIAKSVFISLKIKSASNLLPLISLISIFFALLMTCYAVKIWPEVVITIPVPSGAVPGGAPKPGFLKPGHVGRTETIDGDALFQAFTGFAYNKFSKLNKVNKTTKILK